MALRTGTGAMALASLCLIAMAIRGHASTGITNHKARVVVNDDHYQPPPHEEPADDR
jgi:hypothetical protein